MSQKGETLHNCLIVIRGSDCKDEAYQLQWDSYRGQHAHIIKPYICSDVVYPQIGLQHGREAKLEIERGLGFYEDYFKKTAGLSWAQVCDTAAQFEPYLLSEWPEYCTEMKGMVCYIRFFCSFNVIKRLRVFVYLWKLQSLPLLCSDNGAHNPTLQHRLLG